MTELEKLIQQKKEIEKKIKEAQGKEAVFGVARLSMYDVHSPRQGEFRIMVKSRFVHPHAMAGDNGRWFSVITSFSEKEAALAISSLIEDLTSLQTFILENTKDVQQEAKDGKS